jgi:hypothetical protein
MVDRRFNRARYDADQMVAVFAARLKDAPDLDAVQSDLTSVIQRALEPAHVSMWKKNGGLVPLALFPSFGPSCQAYWFNA